MTPPANPPPRIMAECPVCNRGYVWIPPDGGTCLWCRCQLVSTQEAPK